MRRIFFNSRGLRAGWRLLIFVAIFVGLGFLANWIIPNIFHPRRRPFLDPVGTIVDELQALIDAKQAISGDTHGATNVIACLRQSIVCPARC